MRNAKNIVYYSVLVGLFFIPFIAFIVPQDMFFPFITGKGFAFRIITEIIFGLWVMLAFIDNNYRPKDSWITRAILVFVMVAFVADIFSQNPYKSFWSNYERMEGFVTIAHLLLYYLVISSVLITEKMWKIFLNTSIGASLIMSFYALLQVLGKATINQGGDRVDATFGNSTYFAVYLLFHIFLCFYMLVGKETKKWQKYIYGDIALFEVVILYFTATRGAILGLIGGLFLSGVFVLWKERENKTVRKISYGLIGGLVAFVLLFLSVRHSDFVENNRILSRFSTLSFSQVKGQGRYYVWPMAIKGFKERPILGWGQESFNYVFNKNYDPRMFGQEEWFDRTHDIFLDWLIAGGILALLAYLSMYYALLFYVFKKRDHFTVLEQAVFVGLISAYLFHNIFVFDNLISYIMFFTILALVHSRSVMNHKPESTFYKKHFPDDVLNYGVLPVTLVVIVAVVYYVNIPAFSANKLLIKAISSQGGDVNKNLNYFKQAYSYDSFGFDEITEQAVQASMTVNASAVPDNFKKEFQNLAETKIKEKLELAPHDARYLVFAGSYFNRLGRYSEALEYLKRANTESPNKQSILFETGTSYIGLNDMKSAFDLFKKAYDLKPEAVESMNIYAIGAIYTKNSAVLAELLKKIDQNIVINDNRYIKAFFDTGDYQAVIRILELRLQKDPKNTQTNFSLASVYNSIGQKQKAVEILRQIIIDSPDSKAQAEQYIREILGQ